MLITLRNILDIAESKNMAIAAFNATSLEGIMAVIEAAEEENTPVILQFANAAHGKYIPLEKIGKVMVMLAEEAKVPVCVHLDHGDNFDEIKTALDIGFSSIMYDGSALSFKENVANTRYARYIADVYGASIEAELGSMGAEGAEGNVMGAYTDPETAKIFVEETDIDALAASFGTVHGIYKSEPKLDFNRIEKIRELTDVPVVMHGGSGISDDDFRKCIDCGVRKINFYTYAAKFAGDAIRKMAAETNGNLYSHDVFVTARESMKETYRDAIRVFRNNKVSL
ncbi:class II fructose-bisphosphate aldolase [Lachnoanaerobaculum umeaense]|uniref:Class II fructose-bisphosphate aldolase n=1 Tax=Lachnoanaerobaculum umeaense TaxID=617123 RepID=A0A385Q3Y3_9FIRM|nr:class II fructose-bisphosphate aldolase [Lachnoanaerobaculum umeaense]AYB00500.1 class II fructose-bisphosphate aldolase [Lachnoanaerobaculum umeaense]PZW98566.1 fructose-bisphosphate aldolase class II [Lachnoanaerobaculum umeaense]